MATTSEIKSRQVVKTRKGDSVRLARIRRAKSVLYFESELKKIDKLLDENDINLEGKIKCFFLFKINYFGYNFHPQSIKQRLSKYHFPKF